MRTVTQPAHPAAPILAAVRAAHTDTDTDTDVDAALPPRELLHQLDRWMSASGMDDAHPWRAAIAATLEASARMPVNGQAGDGETLQARMLLDLRPVLVELARFAVRQGTRLAADDAEGGAA
jgi:hypothetical protein